MDDRGDHYVPVGFRFRPTEQELVTVYLLRKFLGFPVTVPMCPVTVPTCDLYGNTNTWDLWESLKYSPTFNGDEVYVFTLLKKKSTRSSRVNRTMGLGCWSGEDAPKAVYGDQNNPETKVGCKKRFRFEKSRTEHDGGWILIEYSLEKYWLEKVGVSINVNQYQNAVKDMVICKFKKNLRHQSKSPSAVVVTSPGTAEDMMSKKRKLHESKVDEVVVSENNKRRREGRGEADNYQSLTMVEYFNDLSKGYQSMGNDQLMVLYPMSYDANDKFQGLFIGEDYYTQLGNQVIVEDHNRSDQSVTMVESDNDRRKDQCMANNEVMVNDQAIFGYHSHSDQSLTVVESDNNQIIGDQCMINNPFTVDYPFNFGADVNFEGIYLQSIIGEDCYSHPFDQVIAEDYSHSFQSMESDNYQSKGDQCMSNDPLRFCADDGDEEFAKKIENYIETDDDKSEKEETEVDNQSQRGHNSNMYFGFDWLYRNHPDLAPSEDDLCNPQTAAGNAADADADTDTDTDDEVDVFFL